MIRLKDNVDLSLLEKYGHFELKSVVYKDGVPLEDKSLQWWSHWENFDAHGMFNYIEINMASREIKCNGCLNILYKMIKDDLVEEIEWEQITTQYNENQA